MCPTLQGLQSYFHIYYLSSSPQQSHEAGSDFCFKDEEDKPQNLNGFPWITWQSLKRNLPLITKSYALGPVLGITDRENGFEKRQEMCVSASAHILWCLFPFKLVWNEPKP